MIALADGGSPYGSSANRNNKFRYGKENTVDGRLEYKKNRPAKEVDKHGDASNARGAIEPA